VKADKGAKGSIGVTATPANLSTVIFHLKVAALGSPIWSAGTRPTAHSASPRRRAAVSSAICRWDTSADRSGPTRTVRRRRGSGRGRTRHRSPRPPISNAP
jgi:hypothetical protein